LIDTIEKIEETEWGLSVVLKEGITIDDNNVLLTIEYILQELIKNKKNKVIIDATGINRQVSVLRLMDVAELIQRLCKRVKIAFVAPNLADNQNSKAMETFSFNRGVYVQYFHDKLSALDWLLQ
jgi:hypothetical protein